MQTTINVCGLLTSFFIGNHDRMGHTLWLCSSHYLHHFYESCEHCGITVHGWSDSEWKKGVDNWEFCTLLFLLLLDRSSFLFLTRGIKQGSWMSADSTRVYFMGSFGFLRSTSRDRAREHFQSHLSTSKASSRAVDGELKAAPRSLSRVPKIRARLVSRFSHSRGLSS